MTHVFWVMLHADIHGDNHVTLDDIQTDFWRRAGQGQIK